MAILFIKVVLHILGEGSNICAFKTRP